MYDGESSDDVEIVSSIDELGRVNGYGASTGVIAARTSGLKKNNRW